MTPQTMKIPDAKAAVEREKRFQHGSWVKLESKKEVVQEAQRDE